ncbi:MAG: sigma-54-dependent Fis family transcriptional regulator [Planctomycetes bacterium]|nr:sigma-54-dependent Fis family transcriptional regulator [Planctomycetota bacterium]
MTNGRILIVDDEEDMLETCSAILTGTGASIATETDAQRALQRVCSETFDVVLLDIRMPSVNGVDFMRTVRPLPAAPSFVLMTGFPSAQTVEESARLGADGYITKPFSNDQILATVTRALVRRRLKTNDPSSPEPTTVTTFDGMVAGSRPMRQMFALIQQLGPVDIDVLIVGESGTGKELVARSIHQRSPRAAKPFVPVDCGAIPEHLLESQLFGHERGAFTGAVADAMGLMELAHGGTLFLDEICELAPALQAKLLRAIQERKIRRVGGTDLIGLNLRIIAATNRDIDLEVKEARFRHDLYYRLNAIRVDVPPLRDRREDIAPLFDHFLERLAGSMDRPPLRVESAVYDALNRYCWPGNVRELQNLAHRTAVICTGETAAAKDLPPSLLQESSTLPLDFLSKRALKVRDFELDYISELMHRYGGNIQAAIEESRLSRASFYRLLKKYGMKGHPQPAASSQP